MVVILVLKANTSDKQNENPAIEHIIEVYPPDYVALKEKIKADSKKIADLQHRCHSLKHILAFGDISAMTQIIQNYKSISDFYITQLAKEIEIYRFSEDNRAESIDFVNYLRSSANDIEEMLLIDN